MTKKISVLQIRFSLGEILDKVNLRDDKYIIERKGKRIAALVPVWQLEKWEKERRGFFDNQPEKEKQKVAGKTAGSRGL
jgi:prevent-host-death family protein